MSPRAQTSRNADQAPQAPASAALLERDLAAWAGADVAKVGRKDALLGRVERLQLGAEGRLLEARVRGERPTPHAVRVWDEDGSLTVQCDCPARRGDPCRHGVAALEVLRFPLSRVAARDGRARRRPAGRVRRGQGRIVRSADVGDGFVVLGEAPRNLTRAERVDLARREELRLRKQRARREKARVAQVNRAGQPPRFTVHGRRGDMATVVLRGPKGLWARCDCEDFAENELGTCRHIERVRIWYLRKPKRMPEGIVSFWWQPRPSGDAALDPTLEFRVWTDRQERPAALDRWFDEEGWIRPAPEGGHGPAWVAEALGAAREAARASGCLWDLDTLAESRLSAARWARSLSAPLTADGDDEQVWQPIFDGLGLRLHRYQIEGARFLAQGGRAFLADDMGLGKTVQAIAAAQALRRVGRVRRVLVVCPASLKHQWRREIAKACGEVADVVEGRRAARHAAYAGWRTGYRIVNYELVLRDLKTIRAADADLIVLDEAQRIKNWGTKTARAVKRLRSPYAFILTGTPLENRLLELHSLVEYLWPRALGPRWRLLPYHAVTAEEGRVIAYEGLNVLRDRLRPFFLRRERTQVLDQLPERTDNTFWTGMTPAQRRPYRKHARQLAQLVGSKAPLRQHEVRLMLQLLTRMRILCNAGAQHDWDSFAERLKNPAPPTPAEVKGLASPKLEEFARVLDDLLDGTSTRVVVFSQWERMLRLAQFVTRESLQARGLTSEIFHGGLASAARGRMIERFHSDPGFRVLFSTDAGGLGLNLQEAASIVVNLEVPWNPAVLQQRIGRVHRMGQRRGVQALHFVTRGAIEERVRQVLENKQALFAGLLTDEADRVLFDDDDKRGSLVERVRSLVGDSD